MKQLARCLAFSALLVACNVHALEACWVAPTENVDGSALTDLDAFRIYYGIASRDYTQLIHLDDETLTCHSWTTADGDYFIAMTALDVDGNESAYSNEVLKTEGTTPPPDPLPMPPVILGEEEVVYTVVKQPNKFILLPVGTVPAGTTCDLNNTTNGHGAVPTDDVVWTSATGSRPIVVVAQCTSG